MMDTTDCNNSISSIAILIGKLIQSLAIISYITWIIMANYIHTPVRETAVPLPELAAPLVAVHW